MYKYIQGGSQIANSYPEFAFNLLEEFDSSAIRSDIEKKIVDVLESNDCLDYVRKVVVDIGTLSVPDIRIFPTDGSSQLRVTSSSNTLKSVSYLINKLNSQLPRWLEKKRFAKDAAASGKKTILSMYKDLLRATLGRFDCPFESKRVEDTSITPYFKFNSVEERDEKIMEFKQALDQSPVGRHVWYSISISPFNELQIKIPSTVTNGYLDWNGSSWGSNSTLWQD